MVRLDRLDKIYWLHKISRVWLLQKNCFVVDLGPLIL